MHAQRHNLVIGADEFAERSADGRLHSRGHSQLLTVSERRRGRE